MTPAKIILGSHLEKSDTGEHLQCVDVFTIASEYQGCISCGMCSYPELTKDHVLTSGYVKIFRTVTRNAVNKIV